MANMNRLAEEDLVGRTFGSPNGGKAWLTPAGEAAIAQFWELIGKFRVLALMIKKLKLAGILTIAVLYIEWP